MRFKRSVQISSDIFRSIFHVLNDESRSLMITKIAYSFLIFIDKGLYMWRTLVMI